MINERELRSEFRQALDEVLPPAPWLEAAVAQDLRRRRQKMSGEPRRRDFSLPRRMIAPVAAVLIVVLAAAAVVTFVDLRSRTPQIEPAGSLTIPEYQALIDRDMIRWTNAGNPDYYTCADLHSPCEEPGHPFQTALQDWLSDVNRVTPPAPFIVSDAQLKRHIAALMADSYARFAAYRAQDQIAFDRAGNAVYPQIYWVNEISISIVASVAASAATYIADVQAVLVDMGACAGCQALITNSDSNCAQIQIPACQIDIGLAAETIGNLQALLVERAAPSTFVTRDAQLQRDLAQADTGLLAMSTAAMTNDQATFDAGRAQIRQAWPAIRADITAILDG
jgi:hypothetical protein